MRLIAILLTFLLLAPVCAVGAEGGVTAIKAGTILPISGKPIEDGVILIEDGRIANIGKGLKIPDEAKVIDVCGKVVMPGLVDASAAPPVQGNSTNEESSEITPALHISTALDPQSKILKRSLQTGVTTLYVSPGWSNVIGGLGAVVKPKGRIPQEMIIKDEAALAVVMTYEASSGNRIPRASPPVNFYYRRPTTRMATIWMLRKSLFDAQQYAELEDANDPNMAIMSAVLEDEIPVRLVVRLAINIRTALSLADTYGFRLVLDECTEGYKVAEEIAKRKVPVVLGPFYYYPENYIQYREGRDVNWNNAGIMEEAGVQVALASGMQSQSMDLLTSAAFAVRHGMSREGALKAITATPAEILGVADRVGTLEKGKDADILILSGDPLQVTTKVEQIILNGKTVHKAN
jgi:imidazolonepropionase-like amidohydrolase